MDEDKIEMVENPRYVSTMRGYPTTSLQPCDSNNKKRSAGRSTGQSNYSKIATILAFCSILLVLCSLTIATYTIVVLQTRVDNLAIMLTDPRIGGMQMPPAAVQQEDMKTTRLEVRILAGDVSRLTDMIMGIKNISRAPPGEN